MLTSFIGKDVLFKCEGKDAPEYFKTSIFWEKLYVS